MYTVMQNYWGEPGKVDSNN